MLRFYTCLFRFSAGSTCFGLLCFFLQETMSCAVCPFLEGFMLKDVWEWVICPRSLQAHSKQSLTAGTNKKPWRFGKWCSDSDYFRLPKQLMALWNTRKNGWCGFVNLSWHIARKKPSSLKMMSLAFPLLSTSSRNTILPASVPAELQLSTVGGNPGCNQRDNRDNE